MFRLDLSRPDYAYALVWLTPIFILKFFQLDFFVDLSEDTYQLVVFTVLSFFPIYLFLKLILNSFKRSRIKIQTSCLDIRLKYFIDKALVFWFLAYVVVILYSKGTPLIWMLMGTGKSYADFGIPSFSGFIYMFRAFLLVGCLHVYLKTKSKRYLKISILFIFLAFINELSRGNGVILILHPIGFFLILKKIEFKKLVKMILFTGVFILIFGVLEQLRYLNNVDYNIVEKYKQTLNVEEANLLSVYSLPVLLYATTPIQNLNYQISFRSEPSYYPYHSTQGLFPSFIRESIFEGKTKDYGLLLSDSYNTTSYFSPLIRDFGIPLTILFVLILQVVLSIIHILAKSGREFFLLLYPPFFMAIVMSPFSLFFTSLVVVTYPLTIITFNTIKYRDI